MQPCNRIYYSKIYWRLNMFQAAYNSSSGAPKLNLQPLVCIDMWWPAVVQAPRVPTQPGQRPVTTCLYKPEAANTVLELLMMSGMPLETCWAFSKFWNNKFNYKVASCLLFLLIHTAMHGSMNIKFINVQIFIIPNKVHGWKCRAGYLEILLTPT
jgi:hypothetical protein